MNFNSNRDIISYRLLLQVLIVFTFVFLVARVDAQEERITNYNVDIVVQKDRSIVVTETLDVHATGQNIVHGLRRNLPNRRNINGKTIKVDYNFEKVLLNGNEEEYFIKTQEWNDVLYIGSKHKTIPPGDYTFTIQYHTENQVGIFDKFDEIYWNAVGNSWDFFIDKAQCTIHLPQGAEIIQDHCYTGNYQSKESNCSSQKLNNTTIRFASNSSIPQGEAFTIGVGFTKGTVTPPSIWERFGLIFYLFVGIFGLLAYFFSTWSKFGRDPEKPIPFPLFSSPNGLSPASLSYILHEKIKSEKVSASIIHLAVKGYLKIYETEKSGMFQSASFRLEKLKPVDSSLPKEEQELMNYLFNGQNIIGIGASHDPNVEMAHRQYIHSIGMQHQSFVSEGNNQHFLFAPFLAILALLALSWYYLDKMGFAFESIGIGIFALFFIAIPALLIYGLYRLAAKYNIKLFFYGVFVLIGIMIIGSFSIFSASTGLFSDIFGSMSDSDYNAMAFVLFLITAIGSMAIYSYLIRQPKIEKLRLQSEIEGFKMYLEMAEKNRINLLNPPDMTPEHFEAMLPFAFALGIEHQWSDKFKQILERANYQPQWANTPSVYYMGNFGRQFDQNFTTASTPPPPEPSSFGGSGGGGFSGGGGGGGGGGGW